MLTDRRTPDQAHLKVVVLTDLQIVDQDHLVALCVHQVALPDHHQAVLDHHRVDQEEDKDSIGKQSSSFPILIKQL